MEALEQRVLLAKTDERELEQLIEEHRRWILSCAHRTAGRFVTESDDEWSVALLAFSEAVQSFEPEKGAFLGFASVVIRRRLVDWLRREGKHAGEITVLPGAFEGALSEEEASGTALQTQQAVAQRSMAESAEDSASRAREEIAEAQALLAGYGFSFFDLADCSPKAEKTRKACAAAVRSLLAEPALLSELRKTRTLPMKELAGRSGVPRKVLDRHRKYLIAAAELLSGDFPILAQYMDYIRKG